MHRIFFVLPCLALAFCFGCTEAGPKMAKVSGTVQMDGQPMKEGTVMFRSVAEGTLDQIEVKDGKFEGEAHPGDRRVEIAQLETVVLDPQMNSTRQINHVAKEFNDNSTLTAKVNPGGPNNFTFEVKSDPQAH
jgi:hypothetical protein